LLTDNLTPLFTLSYHQHEKMPYHRCLPPGNHVVVCPTRFRCHLHLHCAGSYEIVSVWNGIMAWHRPVSCKTPSDHHKRSTGKDCSRPGRTAWQKEEKKKSRD